jgi:hypothetical protein
MLDALSEHAGAPRTIARVDVVRELPGATEPHEGPRHPASRACQRACPALEESMHLIVENLTLFRRPWAAVHRHLSGRARVVPLDGRLDHDKSAFDLSGAAQDGVYVLSRPPDEFHCSSASLTFRISRSRMERSKRRPEPTSFSRMFVMSEGRPMGVRILQPRLDFPRARPRAPNRNRPGADTWARSSRRSRTTPTRRPEVTS